MKAGAALPAPGTKHLKGRSPHLSSLSLLSDQVAWAGPMFAWMILIESKSADHRTQDTRRPWVTNREGGGGN